MTTWPPKGVDWYYSDDFTAIACGDCREILPTLDKCDLVLTDPPYGINWKRGANIQKSSKPHKGIANDADTTYRDWILDYLPNATAVVFGSFYAPFPKRLKQVLVWRKPGDSGVVGSVTGFRRDAEPIFLVGNWPQKKVEQSSVLSSTIGQSSTTTETGHPHTKPIGLIVQLIRAMPDDAQTILDPFMGSGTTLVAAKQLGRKSIGIELEERYCQIAANRLRQEYLPLKAPEPATLTTPELFT